MKILITTNDITSGGGVERVVCNLANTFDESGFDVEILSFYHKNDKCPYTLNPNIVLSFFPNTLNVHTKHPLKRIFNKTIYRFFVAYKMKQMFKDKDIILYNCYFFPILRTKIQGILRFIIKSLKEVGHTKINFLIPILF